MGTDDRTDRFRPVFEPEDIFDRFVRNANASTEEVLPRDDEPTGRVDPLHPRDVHSAHTVVKRADMPAQPAAPAGEPPSHEWPVLPGGRAEMPTPALGARGRVAPSVHDQVTRIQKDPSSEHETALFAVDGDVIVPRRARGGPPAWDHAITVKAEEMVSPRPKPGVANDGAPADGTRPDVRLRDVMPPVLDPWADHAGGAEDALDLDDPGEVDVDLAPLEHPPRPVGVVPRSPLTDSGQRILLLTKVKQPMARAIPDRQSAALAGPPTVLEPLSQDAARPNPFRGGRRAVIARREVAEEASSDGGLLDETTPSQQDDSMRVVPDIAAASRRSEDTYVSEGVEDGQMPTRELDQILSDMHVLVRYGHSDQVIERLGSLRRFYPDDLLLMRRIAEFHVEHAHVDAALDTLFALAGALFERRNLEGMRQSLEQVLILDPENERAYRLLALLEQRDDDDTLDP